MILRIAESIKDAWDFPSASVKNDDNSSNELDEVAEAKELVKEKVRIPCKNHNWFERNVNITLGRGDCWVGEPLKRRFDRLFSLSMDKNATVADMRSGEWDNTEWHFRWRRELFEWEAEMLRYLIDEIENVSFRPGSKGFYSLACRPLNCYSAKSAYSVLSKSFNPDIQVIYNKAWNKFVPLKVLVFAWQAIQNRILSKENLVKRGILNTNACSCECDCRSIESTSHLFFPNVQSRVKFGPIYSGGWK